MVARLTSVTSPKLKQSCFCLIFSAVGTVQTMATAYGERFFMANSNRSGLPFNMETPMVSYYQESQRFASQLLAQIQQGRHLAGIFDDYKRTICAKHADVLVFFCMAFSNQDPLLIAALMHLHFEIFMKIKYASG